MNKIYHPLLALIASATDNKLAEYVEYLKYENKILRARIAGQIHTTYQERQTLMKYGKVIGRAIEELISIVSPTTFYNWVQNAKNGKPKPKNPKGSQRKPKELRESVDEITVQKDFYSTWEVADLMNVRQHTLQVRWCSNARIEAEKDPATGNWRIPGHEYERLRQSVKPRPS